MKRWEIIKLLETDKKVLDLLFIQNFNKQTLFENICYVTYFIQFPKVYQFTNYRKNILHRLIIRVCRFYSEYKAVLDGFTVVPRGVYIP